MNIRSTEKKKVIITIDGPAGAGKSTVSKILAEKLGYLYLDTGSLYRALAYQALKSETLLDNESALADLCSRTEIKLKNIDGKMKVFLDGMDVAENIRSEEVGVAASKISAYAAVRQCLFHLQRQAGADGKLVAEGRDMGTVVFPHADYKFYLDASMEERTKRRLNELLEKRKPAEYQSVQKDIMARDQQDTTRQLSPLKIPADAIIIDSTNLSVAEVVKKIFESILNK
ncbi:MAG TPA: (d)CMP kinase [Smithellaceae bacterium]|nr:(d)CMP kinase [Smithellaceae bacterium]HNV63825.1 (d)CMP kinase [Smithellaceae bacterium]HOD30051.1 (d)CMP kinase [Smithellaceae bacterium]HOF77770.1 (d)CMP kinase [Smithellaceae bacterium]HOM69935.1 (d)CMP kinase [Smithellaceae bacterium]